MDFHAQLVVRSTRPEDSSPPNLRPPEQEDWQRWQPRIVTRYKSSPARIFTQEMEAEGLRITVKMLRDRYRRWGINDKNRKSSTKKCTRSTVAATHKNAARCYHEQRVGGETQSNDSLQLSLHIPKESRLLQQALKSVHDWQLNSNESRVGQDVAKSASIWLRAHLKSMRWAIHCLENNPSCDQSGLAFTRLRETSVLLGKNLEARCTPPALLMSMTTFLKFGSSDDRPSSIYYYTARRFLLGITAEALSPLHPTLLLLRLFLGKQTPETLPAVCRAGGSVIGQCIGTNTQEIWTSQIDLSHAAVMSDTSPKLQMYMATPDAKDSSVNGNDFAATSELTYVYRLNSLSTGTLRAQHPEGFRKAYGAYQLLAASQNWLGDSTGERVSLRNALQLARLMGSDADDRHVNLSFELLQAIRELYSYYEHHHNFEECRELRLEYPGPFGKWDSEL